MSSISGFSMTPTFPTSVSNEPWGTARGAASIAICTAPVFHWPQTVAVIILTLFTKSSFWTNCNERIKQLKYLYMDIWRWHFCGVYVTGDQHDVNLSTFNNSSNVDTFNILDLFKVRLCFRQLLFPFKVTNTNIFHFYFLNSICKPPGCDTWT